MLRAGGPPPSRPSKMRAAQTPRAFHLISPWSRITSPESTGQTPPYTRRESRRSCETSLPRHLVVVQGLSGRPASLPVTPAAQKQAACFDLPPFI